MVGGADLCLGQAVAPILVVPRFFLRAGGMEPEASFPRRRPSASHAASLQAEIERVRRMTIEERIKAALGMSARFAELRPAPSKD
jgi:hypothetical protein